MQLPRLVVAGTHSGAGKTTFSLALMAAFARAGLCVCPFKCGPDYIDPAFHAAAAGRHSYNLDAWLMPENAVREVFLRHAAPGGQSIALVEGVMGLFDGIGTGSRCSTAHVAALVDAPVLLVVNAEGLSLSAAALVQGFARFNPAFAEHDAAEQGGTGAVRVEGVVFNRVSGEAHYALLREAVTRHTGIACYGFFPKNAAPRLPSRHLGLVPAQEQTGLADYCDALASLAERHLDLAGILALARSAPPAIGSTCSADSAAGPSAAPKVAPVQKVTRPLTIGVARDKAFTFTYADNLAALTERGAALHFFSPLHDKTLPDKLDGIYLCGGFPEIFAPELEANKSFRLSLCNALEKGLPAYAECGGMLYLCQGLRLCPGAEGADLSTRNSAAENVRTFAMAGFFPVMAEMTNKLQTFGYITLTLAQESVIGAAGQSFPAHEFHYSRLCGSPGPHAARMEKPSGASWSGGMVKNRVFAMYPHLHFRGAPDAAGSFIRACQIWRESKENQ